MASLISSTASPVFVKESQDLLVFPNPFHNKIKIESQIQFESIGIYTTLGELVFSEELQESANSYTLKNLNLNDGIYIIEVKNKFKKLSVKLVK